MITVVNFGPDLWISVNKCNQIGQIVLAMASSPELNIHYGFSKHCHLAPITVIDHSAGTMIR